MLVSCRVKDGHPRFEVHKQGLSILRSLKNKRLRIIFNISYSKKPLQLFNSSFLCQPHQPSLGTPSSEEYRSQLWISPVKKQLSNNRIIIFLNAQHNTDKQVNCNSQKQEQQNEKYGSDAHMLVIGYLIASVFLYHENGAIGDGSLFTRVMGGLGAMLQDTDILKLEQDIKFTKGCISKPYLLYLLTKPQSQAATNYHDLFRETYKYTPGHQFLNKAVDTLIDYFPERSATYVGDYGGDDAQSKDRIAKIGSSYLESIMGRQMFNFQITGGSLQSLCFQLCEVFNTSTTKSINLQKLYNKILQNQKSQLTTLSTHNYTKIIQQMHTQLPLQPINLMTSYYKIQKYVIRQCIDYAANCMTFYEFVECYDKLESILAKGWAKLLQVNKEKWRNYVVESYQAVQQNLDEEKNGQNQHSKSEGSLDEVASNLLKFSDQINMLIDSIVTDYTARDLLSRLLTKNSQQISQSISNICQSHIKQAKENKQKISALQLQNKAWQYKLKQLEGEYLYVNGINEQFKTKLLTGDKTQLNDQSMSKDSFQDIIVGLKKRVMQLELQLADKNSVINNLSQILDKLEVDYSKKYNKHKFSKQCQSLLSDLTQKSHTLFSLFTELKKTEMYYKQISEQFQKKKEQYNKQREKDKNQLQQCKQKIKQFLKQRSFMEEIITESKRSITVLENVKQQYKFAIGELQDNCGRGKCLLAEMEGEFEKWKKALELVVTYTVNGKVEKLKDFYKVTTEEQLKETLKPIFKK